MSRVLLTGATGFIGRGAIAPLLATGAEVHAVSSRRPPSWNPEPVVWHRVNLLEDDLGALVNKVRPTRLLHFAWDVEPGRFWTSEDNLRWVEASLRLLRAFAAAEGERAVFAGTCAEYAWEHETHCIESRTSLAPTTLYGAAKHGLRAVAEAHARQHGYAFAWGRIFSAFGPHDNERRLGGSVSTALVSGRRAQTSHGAQVRDFLYAPELAEAFVALLGSEVTGAVNVASGRPVATRELIWALAEAAGRPELIEFGARPTDPMEPASLTADVRRLREEVGWRPTRSLEQAAHDTILWWRSPQGGK